MKKIVSLLMSIVFCLTFCSCSGGKKKAFALSKQAYTEINSAYELVEQFGSDIYDTWHIGIYKKDELLDGGCAYLAKETNLSEDEIKDGIAYAMISLSDDVTWDTATEEQKDSIRNLADNFFYGAVCKGRLKQARQRTRARVREVPPLI